MFETFQMFSKILRKKSASSKWNQKKYRFWAGFYFVVLGNTG